MEIKRSAVSYRNWFTGLKPFERYLLVGLIAVLILSFCFNVFLKPMLNEIAKIKKDKNEAQERARLIKSQLPSLDKTKLELDGIKKNIAEMKLKIGDVESKLLGPSQIPQLLTELIKCAQGLKIDFQSVKQKIETDKEGFSRLYIDLKFESNYEDTVNYIDGIESISPFIQIEKADVVQSKEDPRNSVNASLLLSLALAPGENFQGKLFLAPTKETAKRLIIARNPLTPRFSTTTKKHKELKLTGITYRGKEGVSSAIVNDNVVKAGDEIEGQKVVSISFDAVTINDGIEDRQLKME